MTTSEIMDAIKVLTVTLELATDDQLKAVIHVKLMELIRGLKV